MSRTACETIEILAPAGSREQLVAAVRAGADAVYLGAGGLNARRNAENFSDVADLREAVAYCHAAGVDVHLTSNILVRDDEWEEAERLLETACALGIDAVIVQDSGLARFIHAAAPDLVMHASTQMSLHTAGGARAAAEMGFRRAVLARELSGEEIREIVKASPIETEVFIHGALCMSVSGQCLFSAVLGGRSGNRGLCAQPCRLPFRVAGDGSGFDGCMSLRDMSHISHIPSLQEMGVRSVKIEGRMKRPEYVAAAVTACRLMRDEGEVPPDLAEKLTAVFSRSGFTDGYFTGKRGRGMFGTRTKEDVTSASAALLHSLHPLYKNEYSRVPLDMTLTAEGKDTPARLTVRDAEGHTAVTEGDVPETAQKAPFGKEYAARVLGKTGGTPYYLHQLTASVGEGLTVPSGKLAAMKRDALAGLDAQRRAPVPISFDPERAQAPSVRRDFDKSQPPALRAVFHAAEQVPLSLPPMEMAFLPLETDAELLAYAVGILVRRGVKPAVEAPRGIFGKEKDILRMAEAVKFLGVTDIMIHNVGLIPALRNMGMTLHGGFGLNVFNSWSLDAYRDMGLADSELSFEMTLRQIAALASEQPRGMVVRGRIPMMLTRNCPAALSPKGCLGKAKEGGVCGLTDRTGRELPVMCRMGSSEIFNPVMMSVTENVVGRTGAQLGLDWVTFRFTDEDAETCSCALHDYAGGAAAREPHLTAGLYFKGVL